MTDTFFDRIAKFRELCACFKGHSDDPPDNPCDCTCHENETVPGQREHIAELRSLLSECQQRIEALKADWDAGPLREQLAKARRQLESAKAEVLATHIMYSGAEAHFAEKRKLKQENARLAEKSELKTREIDRLNAQLAEVTRKGESLCCQNGNLLVQEHDLKSKLERAEALLKRAKLFVGNEPLQHEIADYFREKELPPSSRPARS